MSCVGDNVNYICVDVIKMTYFTLSNLPPHSVTLTFTRGRCQGRWHRRSEMPIALQNADKCAARNLCLLIGHWGNRTSPELTRARSAASAQQNCERDLPIKASEDPESTRSLCISQRGERAAPSSPA